MSVNYCLFYCLYCVGVIILTLGQCISAMVCYSVIFPFPYSISFFFCLYNFTVITQCACDNLTILQICRFANLQIYRFISFQPCSSIIKIYLSLLLFFVFFLSFCFFCFFFFYNMLLASSRH